MGQRLLKSERLHSQKLIKELFDKGSSFFLYPFKVFVLDVPINISDTHQALFSVSKKKIKKAVARNFVKRRMKEAYRVHKQLIPDSGEFRKLIGFVYVSSELSTFQEIEKIMLKVLERIGTEDKSANRHS